MQLRRGLPSRALGLSAKATLTSFAVHCTFLPYESFKQLFGGGVWAKAGTARMAIESTTKISENFLQQFVRELTMLLLGSPKSTCGWKSVGSRLSETKWRAAGKTSTHI